jgi:hypothetical protein
MRQEVDLALKEMKVGSTLDQALLHMAARVGSRQLDSALSSILIGRQVGGNLPRVLETTAGTLREMRRLEGVVRTKTAGARASRATSTRADTSSTGRSVGGRRRRRARVGDVARSEDSASSAT